MVSFRSILFFAVAVIAPVVKAAALDDLKAIHYSITNLTAVVQGYTGTGAQSVAIGTRVKDIVNKVNTANSNAAGQPSPTAAQAQIILDYVKNTLCPDLRALLAVIRSKKASFSTAGIKPNIIQYLKDVKSMLEKLLDTFIYRAPSSPLKSAAEDVKYSCFTLPCQDAITYLSSGR